MQGQFRAGKGSRIVANGTTLTDNEWSVTIRGDDLDTTFFEEDQEQGLVGVQGLDYDCKGNWNAAQDIFQDPIGIFPQDSFPGIKLYENVGDNDFWDIPFARIISMQNSATARGLIPISFSGKAQPGWITP